MNKRRLSYLVIGGFLLAGIILAAKPVVRILAERVVKKYLAADTISIQSVGFPRFNEVCFLDVAVQKNGVFSIKLKKVTMRLRLKSNISSGLSRNVFLPQVECIDADVKITDKNVKLAGLFSFNVDFFEQKIYTLYLNISSFEYQTFHLENALLWAVRGNERGNFTVDKMTYGKASVTQAQSFVRFENQDLLFDDLSAKFLGGQIRGSIVVKPDVLPQYQAKLQLKGLDLSRFVEDFELANKFTITGKLGGNIVLQGEGAVVKVLGGDLFADAFGGRLMIKDVSFLDHIAYRASLDTVVESLQDYYYNTGSVNLSLHDGDLLADIHLDGKQGKRDFNIILHH